MTQFLVEPITFEEAGQRRRLPLPTGQPRPPGPPAAATWEEAIGRETISSGDAWNRIAAANAELIARSDDDWDQLDEQSRLARINDERAKSGLGALEAVAGEEGFVERLDEQFATGRGLLRKVPVVGVGAEALDLGKVYAASQRMDRGEATAGDLTVLADYFEEQVSAARGRTVAGGAVDILSQTIPFMGEFLISGGIAPFIKAGARKAATKTLERTATRSLARSVGRAVTRAAEGEIARGGVRGGGAWLARQAGRTGVEAAARVPVIWAIRAPADVERRLIAGDDFLPALSKTLADQAIEIYSELSGQTLAVIGGRAVGVVGVGLKRTPLRVPIERLAAARSSVVKWMMQRGIGAERAAEYLRRVGYHGVLAEMGEERLGEIMRGLTPGLEAEAPDLKQLAQEALAFSVPGLARTAVGALVPPRRYQPEQLRGLARFYVAGASDNPVALARLHDLASTPEPSRRQIEELGLPIGHRVDRAVLAEAVRAELEEPTPATVAEEVLSDQAARPELAEAREETAARLMAVRAAPVPAVEAPSEPRAGAAPAEPARLAELPLAEEAKEPPEERLTSWPIIRAMDQDFDVAIRIGHMQSQAAGAAGGIYKTHPQVVRQKGKFGGDLGIASHEVAHHIDETNDVTGKAGRQAMPPAALTELRDLDYDKEREEPRPEEGFAEFMRFHWMEGNTAEKAPAFHRWFFDEWLPEHPELQAKVEKTKAAFEAYKAKTYEQRVREGRSKTGKPARPLDQPYLTHLRHKLAWAVRRVYAAMKSEEHFLAMFSAESRRRAKKFGYKLPPGESAYELFVAFSRWAPVAANDAIDGGVFFLSDPAAERKGPSLVEVFAMIEAGRHEDFIDFCWARHAREAWKKGQNPGMSPEEAEHVHTKHFNPVWEEAAQKWTDFNNSLIRMLADSGVLNTEEADRIINAYDTYLPLLRVREGRVGPAAGGRRLADVGPTVHRRAREGSGYQILDPLQSTIERTIRFYERAASQEVINKVIETAETIPGLGRWVEALPADTRPTIFAVREVVDQLAKAGLISETEVADLDDALKADRLLEAGDIDRERLQRLSERFGDDKSDADTEDAALAENVTDAARQVLETRMTIWRPNYNYRGVEPIARVLRAGKPRMYQFDPDMYRFVTGMEAEQSRWILEAAFGKFTHLLKLGATRLNPSFAARNLFRDQLTFLIQAKAARGAQKAMLPPEMMAAYVYTAIQKKRGKEGDPIVRLWEQMGGPLAPILGVERSRKRIRTKVREIMGDSALRKTWNVVNPLNLVEGLVGVSEVTPRLAEFKAVLEKHGYGRDALRRGKRPPRPVVIEAINAAHDVTVNFKRMGYIGRHINQYIPFFNAAMEGADKFARTWRDQPVRTFAWSLALAGGTAAYWMMRKDCDDYKEQPDWLKYGFWTITDENCKPIARLPRPFEWGWLISAGTEALLNAINDRAPEEMGRYTRQMAQSLIPGLDQLPAGGISIVTPVLETWLNRDFFRDQPIVSPYVQERREPRDWASPYNSLLMRKIGDYLNWSPAKMEHFVNGLTGGLYRNIVVPTERLLTGGEFAEGDLPVIGGFQLRKDYTESVDEFYDARTELRRKRGSAQQRGDVPPELEARYKRFEEASGLISDLRDQIRDVRNRDERFAYEKYIIGLAREVLDKEPLERYPSLLSATGAPPAADAIRREYLTRKLLQLSAPKPRLPSKPLRRKDESSRAYMARLTRYREAIAQRGEKTGAHGSRVDEAVDLVRRADLDFADAVKLLRAKGYSDKTYSARLKALRQRWPR